MRSLVACCAVLFVVACGSADDGGGAAVDADNGPPCADGCTGGDVCVQGECVPASCRDKQQGGDETDIDCGGGCLACSEGQGCEVADDCLSKFCDSDSICRDCQDTSDCAAVEGTYCGAGSCVPVKADEESCASSDECESGFCAKCCVGTCETGMCTSARVCLEEMCEDGVDNDLDGLTDEDCGSNPY